MTIETSSVVEQPVPLSENHPRPYPPSWIDRFNDWVNRLTAPAWLFYLGIWLLLILIESGAKWLDGVEPAFRLRWIYAFYSFYGIYFLAAIHYLDTWAKTSFDTFRSTLAVSRPEQSRLFYQLTTMPARTVWILSASGLACMILLTPSLVNPLWEAMGFSHSSTAARLVDLAIIYFNGLVTWIFVYHTLRQLRWISRIHKAATRIDLFQLRPLYSLSGLTARTAGILLLVGFVVAQQGGGHGELTSDAYALRTGWLFTLISMLVYSLLAVAVFFLPLLGLHQLLIREKERLQAEANSRLQAHIQELHRRLDASLWQDADKINLHLNSLSLERDILSRLPTWPWQPGTLNLILTAVLLPLVIWIIQKVFERWVGF